MPVLPADVKEQLRQVYLTRIHNAITRVRKITGYTTASSHPAYIADEVPVLEIFTGFKCSIYHILSGKLNRVFKERDPSSFLAELGIMTEDVFCVDYVCDLMITKESDESVTMVNNLVENEEVEINGKWWKVRKVVPDSEGVQHQVLCIK